MSNERKQQRPRQWELQTTFSSETDCGLWLTVEVHRNVAVRYPQFSLRIGAKFKQDDEKTLPFIQHKVEQNVMGYNRDNTAETLTAVLRSADQYIDAECKASHDSYIDYVVHRDAMKAARDRGRPYKGSKKKRGNKK